MDSVLNRIANFLAWAIPPQNDLIAPKTPAIVITDASDSDAVIQRQIWHVKTASYRKKRIDQNLYSFLFFFGTMLDDPDLHTQLLAEHGDAFLITAPRSNDFDKYSTHKKWLLVFLASDQVIIKAQVVFFNKKFVMMKDKKMCLQEFMKTQNLRPVDRPFSFKTDQIQPRLPITPSLPFPIEGGTFAVGTISQNTVYFDSKRRIPVITMNVENEDETTLRMIKESAESMMTFGNERLWRIWGICEVSPTNVILVCEDIVYGSLASFVQKHWNQDHLLRFSLQTSEALRYLEKFDFVHPHLSLDSLLLTYGYNVKLAFFGFNKDRFLPVFEDSEDVDRMRWMPPESLFRTGSVSNSRSLVVIDEYTGAGMVYTFGFMVWSMCHGGVLPFEDEGAENIKSREYKLNNLPAIDPEFTPKGLEEVIQKCWHKKPSHRPSFKVLKHQLRHLVQKSIQ